MEQEILEKFGVSEEWIERSAETYESGTFSPSSPDSPIFYGSPAALRKGERYVAVSYGSDEISRIDALARERGVAPDDIYRLAVDRFLQTA